MKFIAIKQIALFWFLTASVTANAQDLETYKSGSISIDSAKADRIQTELLKVPVLYALIAYKDSIIHNRQSALECEREKSQIIANRRNYLEKETKAKGRKVFKRGVIIVGLVAGIVFENYLIFFK